MESWTSIRTSQRANIACKEAIEAAISEHYRDNRLDGAAVGQVAEQFGYDRMLYVLANTVQQQEWDGRFSRANKAWAGTVEVPPNPDSFGGERNREFVVDSHPGLTDLFLTLAKREYLLTQLRCSVRRQLKQEPRSAGKSAEKKAPARKKQEPER